MTLAVLLESVEDGVVRLILNRPQKLNALDAEMRAGFMAALASIDASDEIRVVILTGAGGRAFCVGGDIDERRRMGPKDIRKLRHTYDNPYVRLWQARPPVIAAISGFCLGGGLELALAADFRIADDSAEFGLPEVTLGTVPAGGGTQRLSRVVGLSQAKRLIFTGERISAARAFALGLVDELSPAGALDETALRFARTIARSPALAVAEAKRCMNLGFPMASVEGLALEAESYLTCVSSPERAAALEAFVQRKAARDEEEEMSL